MPSVAVDRCWSGEPVFDRHQTVRKVMVFLRTEKVTEIPPPLTRRNGERVHPADMGAGLIHGTPSLFQKDADIHRPDRVQQKDWRRYAVCGRRPLLERVRAGQKQPERWRIVPEAFVERENGHEIPHN